MRVLLVEDAPRLAQAVADSGRPYDAGRIERRITESKAKKE